MIPSSSRARIRGRPTTVRSAARAVVISGGSLLAIRMKDRRGEFYILPGGGQRHGETLQQALQREFEEELGAEIRVGPLLYVREYIGCNHTFAQIHSNFHQLEVVFRATLVDSGQVCLGRGCDSHQVGFRWIPLDQLDATNFYPEVLKEFVRGGEIEITPRYLGDIN